jgi:hypothetical protein
MQHNATGGSGSPTIDPVNRVYPPNPPPPPRARNSSQAPPPRGKEYNPQELGIPPRELGEQFLSSQQTFPITVFFKFYEVRHTEHFYLNINVLQRWSKQLLVSHTLLTIPLVSGQICYNRPGNTGTDCVIGTTCITCMAPASPVWHLYRRRFLCDWLVSSTVTVTVTQVYCIFNVLLWYGMWVM